MVDHKYIILVIDDEAITRTTLAALLEKPTYQVEMAEDGLAGFDRAKQINPDVILLDVMMPQMNGYDVCKRIRADPQIGEVPIIMITALDDDEAKLNGLEAGADDFLTKPFNSLELAIRLQTLRQVDRYRHLLQERENLSAALAELSEKNNQLRALSRDMLTAQEKERRAVAVELHSEIGQLVTGLKLILERERSHSPGVISQALEVTNEIFQRLREMSLNLRPTDLDDFGLSAALAGLFKRFTNQTRIAIHHNVDPLSDQRFDKTVETTAFRFIQEGLTNIARHAGVKEATVTLTVSPELMHISIRDSGKGFDVDSKNPGISTGLSSMAERVQMAGGRFTLQSSAGKGTLITADFERGKNE